MGTVLMKSLLIEKEIATLFITSKCNQNCIMCPQELGSFTLALSDFLVECNEVSWNTIKALYITGGEPLLEQNLITEILHTIPEHLEVYILTNGLIPVEDALLKDKRIKFCIPLYGSCSTVHNQVTQHDSFIPLLTNLYYLGSNNCRIEIRTVLASFNIHKLMEFSRFIAMNLPFAEDIAFMGVELVEAARRNINNIFVNQTLFVPELIESILFLNSCQIDAFIYNFPLCYFPGSMHKYLIDSISPRKKYFPSFCNSCLNKDLCPGFFRTNKNYIESKGGFYHA
jgi:His-Xaa-Ser system radical SAM maturase HxsC